MNEAAPPARSLVECQRLLDQVLDRMPHGLMLVDEFHIVQLCNRRALELLDLPAVLMARRPTFVEVLEYQWSTDEFARTPEEIKTFIRGGGILDQSQTYERTRPDGRVIEVQSAPLPRGGVLRPYTDVTERRRAEERIRYRARHDGLTTLTNRETFLELLALHVNDAAIDGRRFAVHYLDLDRFKAINDSMGHAAGDQVLAIVAQRIRHAIRDDDVAGRMGGDEFAIVQSHVADDEQAVVLARRIRHSLEPPVEIDGRSVTIGLSVGIALFPVHGVTADALIRNADAALYEAKYRGGGVVLFTR